MIERSMMERDEPRLGGQPARRDLAAIYAEQRPRLVRLAALILGSTATADDVVHDAFAKLHRHLDTVERPGAWLHTVVVRACANEHRHRQVGRRYAPRLLDAVTLGEPHLDETLSIVRQLPVRQRVAVVLRYYEDRSEAEIATAMGISVGTVKSTLSRALDRLRHLLPKEP